MTALDGHRLLAEGREAEIYEWGDGRVLRLMRTADQRPAMDRGTSAIAVAIECDIPTPAVLEVVEIDGRPGQVMERVDGPDQFTVVAARPWTLTRIARILGRVHADLHRATVPDEHPTVHDRVRARVNESELVPDEVAEGVRVALDLLPSGTALCHGDYHPGNVLMTGEGPVVIDWTNAARGHPMADVARTTMMLRLGEVPPGSPRLVHLLAGVGRGAIGRLYLRAYRRAGKLDTKLADRWEPVRAADRLSEGIESERKALLAICRRGLPG